MFGLELSEDKRIINAYLDVKKFINNQINNSSYFVFIEFGKKHQILYLEQKEPIEQVLYSYEKDFSIEDLAESGDSNVEIALNILYISFK
jgi:hypothetical protein